jgi:hypothetical protein
MKRLIVFVAVIILVILLPERVTFADDATVLPKGVSRIAVEGLI